MKPASSWSAESSARAERLIYYAAVLSVLAAVLLRVGVSGYQGVAPLAATLFDDGFYYTEIAKHISAGHGITFDGVSRTSGFQPLWMCVLAPLSWFAPRSSLTAELMFFAVIFCVAYGGVLWLFARVMREWFGALAAGIAVIFLTYSRVTSLFTGGVEASLLGIMLLLFVRRSYRALQSPELILRHSTVLGWLGGLVILTRLDHIFIVGTMLAGISLLLWQGHRSSRLLLRSWVNMAIGPVILLSVYLGFNVYYFGQPLPISGATKVSAILLGNARLGFGALLGDHGTAAVLFSPLVISTLLCVIGKKLVPDAVLRRTLQLWAVGTATYILFLLVVVSDVAKWYMVSPILLLTAVFAVLIVRLQAARPQWGRFGIALAVLLAGICLWSHLNHAALTLDSGDSASAILRMAEWCDANLPAHAVIGLGDAGMFAAFTAHRVINTDGLVNDWDYLSAYKSGRAIAKLRERGVTHLMTVFGDQVFPIGAAERGYTLRSPLGVYVQNTDTFRVTDRLHSEQYDADYLPGGINEVILWTFE